MWGKRLERALIGLGGALLAVWGGARLHAFVGSRLDRQAFEERRASAPSPAAEAPPASAATTGRFRHAEGNADVSLWSEERVKAWRESLSTDRRVPLALLEVPRLKIEVPVLPGTDDLTLNRGAGWIEGTARPGEPGNVALSAHRDGFFRALKDVAEGDELLLSTPRETTRFVVAWTKVVAPEDVSVLDATEVPSVTLVTCYPFHFVGSAPQRFIVRAERAPGPGSPSPRDPAPDGAVGRRKT